MKQLVKTLCIVSVAGLLLSPAWAQDDAKPKRKRQQARVAAAATAVNVPKTLQLTEEQKKQVAALNKEYGPKLAALRKQSNELLTDDQKAARKEAAAKAKAEGKPPRTALAAVELTAEQKEQQAKIKKEVAGIQKEVRGKFLALLTDEQKKQLREARKAAPKKGKQPAEKKRQTKKVKKTANDA